LNNFSLYIHIPFCAAFCDYCDFYSVTEKKLDGGYINAFLSALTGDIKYQIDFFAVKEISTVYIGGGTPSVLGKNISVLFDSLKKIPNFSPVEFTIEANPESATEEFLSVCKEGGVNRISLGVQTFHEPSRLAVNRQGSASLLEERLALCSRYFSGRLSADLITGLPYQNEKIVIEDIKRILEYEPAHISLYSLSVESGSPLEEKLKTKTVTLPGSDLSDSIWLSGRDALEKAGFCHYEVSNFAKDNNRCLHNVRYWRMESWLGAGPAASGTVIDEKTGTAKRFTYAPDVDAYKNAPSLSTAICEDLDKSSLLRETLLMGYRYREGPDAQKFKQRFCLSIDDCIPQTLTRWKDRDKMLFLNSFLCEAFEELDSRSL